VGTAAATLVVLFLTPYLLAKLGKERFGVFAMANQALVYVGLLTLGLRGAVTRFASKEIAADNLDGLNHTLSCVARFYLVIGLIGVLICGIMGLAVPAFFGVTPEYAGQTRLLFLGVGCNFLLSLLWLTYSSVLVGHQRYDLLNVGNMLRDVGRAVLIVLVFMLGWVTLGGLAAALFVAHLSAFIYFRSAGRWQQPGLRVSLRRAAADTTRQILGFSLWNGLVQIGNVITFATPIFIVGKALGPEFVVFYSVPFMMADRLRIFVGGLGSTLAPMAASTLVTGDREHFRTLLIQGTRAAATLCFPLGAVLLVFCRPFLNIWMGPEYAWSWVVYAVLMIAMFGRISQAPTLYVLVGGGRIRGLAYVQILSAVATIVLTIVLVKVTSWGVVGVAIGVTVPLFVSHTLFLPWYAGRQMHVPVLRYFRESYLWPVLSTLPGVGVAILLRWLWLPTGWLSLIAEFAVSLGVIGVLAWHTCLDRSLRKRIVARLTGASSTT
jgi:O-antigen/teichoic acid export membrane protein